MKALGRDGFFLNRETVSLRCVEQLVDEEQTAALGYCLLYAEKYLMDGRRDLRQVVDELEAVINAKGLEALCENPSGIPFLARPRRQEIFACINRYRK